MIYFTKLEGIGNDFIAINNMENKLIYDYGKLSKYLCNRNLGIGADGVLFAEKSNVADCKMRIFNRDGSEAEMCGNGIRCFAKYIYENQIVNNAEFNIETVSGIKNTKLIFEGLKIVRVLVNMGKPELEFSKIPVYYYKEYNKNYIDIENIKVYPISMGNPHAVCFWEDIENIDIENIGKLIENYKYFPNKTNVEFVKIMDDENIEIRVWERGVGETLACGTGATASVIAGYLNGVTENICNVKLKGGELEIVYNELNNELHMIGTAEFVYEGKLYGNFTKYCLE